MRTTEDLDVTRMMARNDRFLKAIQLARAWNLGERASVVQAIDADRALLPVLRPMLTGEDQRTLARLLSLGL